MTDGKHDLVPERWRARFGWENLPDQWKDLLADFSLDMFVLGQHVVGEIEEVKYDGHVIVLDDGSRWDVEPIDTSTASGWNEIDKVVVIDGKMYNIEDAEAVDVTESD